MIEGGYILQPRKVKESEIAFAPPHVREIWNWLLREANHKDVKTGGTVIKRGQTMRSYRDIQEALHWMVGYRKETYKKWHCEIAMRWLTKRHMITTTKTTRGLLITICNYDHYQDPKNYENDSENDKKTTRKRQGTDTINKNDKNEKKYIYGAENENEISSPSKEEVIQFFRAEGYRDDVAEKFFQAYEAANWHDTKNNRIHNWKQLAILKWFSPDNKATQQKAKDKLKILR
jgi:hypothetical protein